MFEKEHAVIDAAFEQYNPIAAFALSSGGNDSMASTSVAMLHPRVDGVVHIATGIGVDEGNGVSPRAFVERTCAKMKWPLRVIRAKEDCGVSYDDLVMKHGFPGPGFHSRMYIMLKERALRLLIRETKEGRKRRDSIMLITGVRSQESERRMGHVEPIQKEGSKIWVAPIHDWSKVDCNKQIERLGLERSPVVDLIHKSGECLCGAFAKPGELEELRFFCPKTAARIDALAERVKAAGDKNCKWGERPVRGQKIKKAGMLCTGCADIFEGFM